MFSKTSVKPFLLTVEGEGEGGSGGSGSGDMKPWLEQIEESQRGNELLSGFDGPNDLAGAYIKTRGEFDSLKGDHENYIKPLGENPTDEERAEYATKLGRPKTAEGYEFEKVKLPDGVAYSEEFDKIIKNKMFELDIPQKTAKAFHSFFMKDLVTEGINEIRKSSEAEQNKAREELKNDWKDDYKTNVELAVRAGEKIAKIAGVSDDAWKTFLDDSNLGDHPMFIRMFHTIEKAVMDDKLSIDTPEGSADKRETGADGRKMLDFPSMEKK